MRYAKIREMDISNGEGVGISLFVQGCHFHCRGCFNPETWDFSGGKKWTNDVKKQFLALARKPYISRISILGGEPLCNENVGDVLELIKSIRQAFPDKHIWLYTGYEFAKIMDYEKSANFDMLTNEQIYDEKRIDCVKNVDVVVDGQFQLENQDIYNEKIVFAGSTNQNIIRIKDVIGDSNIYEKQN